MSDTFSPEVWVVSDCRVKECDYGLIHYDDRGYTTVARCPRCDRAQMPSLPRYQGAVTLFSNLELERRLAERTEIFESSNGRRKEIAKAILTEGAHTASARGGVT